jgi:hypothetical protein
VYATGDEISETPAEYSRLLASLADGKLASDDYSRGGVEDLKGRMASLLGKERAGDSLPARSRTISRSGCSRVPDVAFWYRLKATCSRTAATAHRP